MTSINLLSQKFGNLRPVLGNAGKLMPERIAIGGIRYAFGTVKTRAPECKEFKTINYGDRFEVRTLKGGLVGTVHLEPEPHIYINHLGHERLFRRPLDENGRPIDVKGGAEFHIFKLIPQIGSIVIPKPSGECRRKIWGVVYDFSSYLSFTRNLYKDANLKIRIIPCYGENKIEIRKEPNMHLLDTIALEDHQTPLNTEGQSMKIDRSNQAISVLKSIFRKALPDQHGQAIICGIRYSGFPAGSLVIKYIDRIEIRTIKDNSFLGTVWLEEKDYEYKDGNGQMRKCRRPLASSGKPLSINEQCKDEPPILISKLPIEL